jgi:cobalt-zinc-cadmium resistance protein CzcA
MLNRLLVLALENRLVVLLVFIGVCAFGALRLAQLPIDAFPDTSPVQVQINTIAPALNATEIEQEITLPIELAISGLPGLIEQRSVSKFGFAQVVAVFNDETNIYSARNFISERLASVDLAEGIDRPQLGPIATGLGEVLHYIVRSNDPSRTLTEIRELHDWVVKPELLKVHGVAEVNSWGGFEKQYHVIVEPELLVKYGITMSDVEEALQTNNENAGGGQVDRSGESLLVHGIGRVSSVQEIEEIVFASHNGQPVFVRDVAKVQIDHEIRRGAVSFQGQGEALLGLGFMLMGENSNEVTHELRARLELAQKALPEDIVITIVYDRTELVAEVISTVKHNLLLGGLLVVVVLFVFLGNIRAGLLVAMTIPMAMFFAVAGMYEMSIAASLLSLGAIDFGILVDGSIVITEVNLRRLRDEQSRMGRKLTAPERLLCIVQSSKEVMRPTVFGMFIILMVFVPILTLEGVEGKMFRPMAWTFILALFGALVITVVLSPVLSYYGLPWNARPERHGPIHALTLVYAAVLKGVLRMRWLVVIITAIILVITGVIAMRLGGEFTPRLSEGALTANVIRLAGVSIPTSIEYNTKIEKILLEQFPNEIKYVWSRIGVAEVATDPMGTELTDIFMSLYPREEWTKADNQAELVTAIENELRDLPGLNMAYSQPIEMRMNELSAGIRSDVGIKIYGDNFEELVRVSNDIQRVLLDIKGSADISVDQITGQPTLRIEIDPTRLSRFGIPRAEVLEFVRALGGIEVGSIYEHQRVFELVLRLPDRLRTDLEALKIAPLPTQNGTLLTLQQVAKIEVTDSPATINREWGRRLIRVQTNARDRDVASFVQEAQRRIDAEVALPEGYVVEWGGQFENLKRAQLRLAIIVPLTLLLVFFLLLFSLRSLRDVIVIYTGVPFAIVGGVIALYMRGIPFSVSAAVGFIALTGIAVLNGQIMVSAIRSFIQQGHSNLDAIIEGGKQRLRPVLATAIVDAAGFIPMAVSTGVGAEVQRPLATVVIGGIISSTLLTLIVLPVLYKLLSPEGKPEPMD